MFYAIRHFTSYRYNRSVWQSMMEVRMHPRSEGNQRCFVFQLSVNPRARIFGYTDSYGNLVHHFDLPSRHSQLTIISDALVNIEAQPSIPDFMEYQGWQELEEIIKKKDYWNMLMPSNFAPSSPELEHPREKCQDPLSLRQRVPFPQYRKCASCDGRRNPCMGGSTAPRAGLGRFRSYNRSTRE